MNALFLWRSTTPVALDSIDERGGIRWAWLGVLPEAAAWRLPERMAPIPLAADMPAPSAARLITFRRQRAKNVDGQRIDLFVETDLDPATAFAAYAPPAAVLLAEAMSRLKQAAVIARAEDRLDDERTIAMAYSQVSRLLAEEQRRAR